MKGTDKSEQADGKKRTRGEGGGGSSSSAEEHNQQGAAFRAQRRARKRASPIKAEETVVRSSVFAQGANYLDECTSPPRPRLLFVRRSPIGHDWSPVIWLGEQCATPVMNNTRQAEPRLNQRRDDKGAAAPSFPAPGFSDCGSPPGVDAVRQGPRGGRPDYRSQGSRAVCAPLIAGRTRGRGETKGESIRARCKGSQGRRHA